jgi:hypothetical protein
VSTVPSAGGGSGTGVDYLWRVSSPGTYSVYAWWTSDASRTTSARYRVYTRDTTAASDRLFDGTRNQRIAGGRWNRLGSWTFPHANAMAKVAIERTGGPGTIGADAVRVVRHDGTGVLPPQPPRPRGWYSRDIGSVGSNGAAVESNGVWNVDGAGADVWGTSDAFQYTYRWLQGNGSITARVADINGTADWTKVGVMMRGTAAANSAHAFMLVANPAKGLAFQYRLSNGGSTVNVAAGTGTAPRWVRLTRSGNSITAAVSSDGRAWTTVSTQTYGTTAMPTNILVGLAVSSHVAGETAEGIFDNLSVVP